MRFRVAILICLLALPASSDEGLWPYNQFPKDVIKEKYNFEATAEFLDHLRLSSVRIANGTGSFVSANGLLLTNQHLIAQCSPNKKNPFYAATQAAEKQCAGMQASVLIQIEDVTKDVKSASLTARNAAIAAIEKKCAPCSVVKLFSGGRYDLYRYKNYTDLRLVFAPEEALAFFGRERDSFTYLRYGMDAAFLRAYEDGKPAATPHYLKWNTEPVHEGDLVFSAGNPAPTIRATTAAQLTFYRDTALPATLARLTPLIQHANQSQPAYTELLESYKAAAGKLIGLRDDRLVLRKTIFDKKIRNAVERDPKLGPEAAKVWDQVAAAYKAWAPYEKAYQTLAARPSPGSRIDITTLTGYLEELKNLGDKSVPLKSILGGKTPAQAAEEYATDEGRARLAKLLEEPARKITKKRDDILGTLEVTAAEKIAGYRFQLFGAADYPDATSTPRVEFGTVKSYTDRAGIPAPFAATFSGLFYRRLNEGPYMVSPRWLDARTKLESVTALDFVSTCDVGGGDAGGPVIDRNGNLVGITFDGNIESLPNTYLYSDEKARAVHVSAQGIAEALQHVYAALPLLIELNATAKAPSAS